MRDSALKEKIVTSLRRLADGLEGAYLTEMETGFCFAWLCESVDGFEICNDPLEAEEMAYDLIQPQDREYEDDVERVNWGIYIPMSQCRLETSEEDEEGSTPEDYGLESPMWAEATLVDAPASGLMQRTLVCPVQHYDDLPRYGALPCVRNVVQAWVDEKLTEGLAAELLGLDRVDLRLLRYDVLKLDESAED